MWKKIAIDTYYESNSAFTVGVIFNDFLDKTPEKIISCHSSNFGPYIPGEFYKRELPCILDLLKQVDLREFDCIIIDGFVELKEDSGEIKHGLGMKLYESLECKTKYPWLSIIGVAKSKHGKCEDVSKPVYRNHCTSPLWVNSVGKLGNKKAKSLILHMAGDYKLPSLLKLLDNKTKGK